MSTIEINCVFFFFRKPVAKQVCVSRVSEGLRSDPKRDLCAMVSGASGVGGSRDAGFGVAWKFTFWPGSHISRLS